MIMLKSPYVPCCLFFFAAVVWAQPEVVYRADLRIPDDVFKRGFPCLRKNVDLHDHVTGISCERGQSQSHTGTAFVDTTENWEIAKLWGLSLTLTFNSRKFYVYKIHATPNFFECYKSVYETYEEPKRSEFEDGLTMIQAQARWLAYGGIAATQIEGAYEVVISERGTIDEPGLIPNGDWDKKTSKANEDTFTQPPEEGDTKQTILQPGDTACVHYSWYIKRFSEKKKLSKEQILVRKLPTASDSKPPVPLRTYQLPPPLPPKKYQPPPPVPPKKYQPPPPPVPPRKLYSSGLQSRERPSQPIVSQSIARLMRIWKKILQHVF